MESHGGEARISSPFSAGSQPATLLLPTQPTQRSQTKSPRPPKKCPNRSSQDEGESAAGGDNHQRVGWNLVLGVNRPCKERMVRARGRA